MKIHTEELNNKGNLINYRRLERKAKLTSPFFSISKMRGDYYSSFFTSAYTQQTFIHASNHITFPNIGVVGTVSRITTENICILAVSDVLKKTWTLATALQHNS